MGQTATCILNKNASNSLSRPMRTLNIGYLEAEHGEESFKQGAEMN